MSLSLVLMAIAFFILILGNLLLSMASLAYVYRVHKWHHTCRRFEGDQDDKIQQLIDTQKELSEALKNVALRHETMSSLLVGLTNEVLSLSQERVKRNSVPPM